MTNEQNPADDPWKGCNPMDPGFRDDPYPSLKRLREREPVNLTPVGIWRLMRHADVQKLLTDVKCGVRTTEGRLYGADDELSDGIFMLRQDPPNHSRLRKLVSHAFTPKALNAWQQEIQRVVDECLDRVADAGEMDVIKDLALPVPSTIICEMLGVRVEDRDRFTQWTSQATFGLAKAILPKEVGDMADAAGQQLNNYFEQLIAERRANPREDLLSLMIKAEEEEGDKLSFDELMAQSVGLLIAGFETTIGLIGNGVRALLKNPKELEKLRKNPELRQKAIQECLRYDGPIVLTSRVLHEDAEFSGTMIPRNSMVWGMLASANRDPEAFPDPDRLHIERDATDHVAFGGGPHFCLGYRLAELEAQAAIATLAQRFKDIELKSNVVEWGASLFRVPGRLPISFRNN